MTRLAAIGGRRALCLLLAAVTVTATVMALIVPGTARAATEATTGGTFSTNDSSSAPLINSVGLYGTDNVAATNMDPTIESWIKVNVTDNQTLEHLSSIQVTIWYDADGDHTPVATSVDNETCAIITWTPTNTWTLTSMGAGSTWTSHAGDTPTLVAQNTGTFVFHFVPGKVATENAGSADWDINVTATDAGSGSDDGSQTGRSMNWYGEISNVTPTVNFGSVSLGTQEISSALSAKYICNGNYGEQAKTDAQWSDGGSYNVNLQASGAPGDGEFRLDAHDDSNTAGEVQLSDAYQDIDGDETMTTEDGHTQSSIYLWLTLGASGIVSGTYNGNINFCINNR